MVTALESDRMKHGAEPVCGSPAGVGNTHSGSARREQTCSGCRFSSPTNTDVRGKGRRGIQARNSGSGRNINQEQAEMN